MKDLKKTDFSIEKNTMRSLQTKELQQVVAGGSLGPADELTVYNPLTEPLVDDTCIQLHITSNNSTVGW